MSDIYIKCENRSAKLNWNELQIKKTQKDAYNFKTKLISLRYKNSNSKL